MKVVYMQLEKNIQEALTRKPIIDLKEFQESF